MSLAKDGKGQVTELPDIKNKAIIEENDEESKGASVRGEVRKRGISQYSRRKLIITNRINALGNKPRRK